MADYKEVYLASGAAFAKLPPLRFAVGDEVKFLHELETESEWRRGRVVELYFRNNSFEVIFTATYRVQLLEEIENDPPVYAWVKADLDRYVLKVGVRSIEGTRYQARLDAEVEVLAQVYCSEEFIQDIYHTLAQDQEFVEMLQSVWLIELSERVVRIYRAYVLYRQPFVRTDFGHHVPSGEEVIAGIKAYFDPAHLSSYVAPATVGQESYSREIRGEIIKMSHWHGA